MKRGIFSWSALVIVAIIASSCAEDGDSWYPSGKAEIQSYYEVASIDTKCCIVTFLVSNTGLTEISACTLSFAVSTDIRTYYRTQGVSIPIPPDKSVYISCTVDYASALENLAAPNVVLSDEFYE